MTRKNLTSAEQSAEKLGNEISHLIINAQVERNVEFQALQRALVLWMMRVCSDCRQEAAHKLMANIPRMLEGADRCALPLRSRACH